VKNFGESTVGSNVCTLL